MKKAEVVKMMRDNDRQGDGLMDWDAFQKISEYFLGLVEGVQSGGESWRNSIGNTFYELSLWKR